MRTRAGTSRLLRALVVACVVGAAGVLPVLGQATPPAGAVAYTDWPMFLQNNSRTNANTDATLNPSVAPLLTLKWVYKTGGGIAASTSIVGPTAYVGSWDGYEYAINTATGTMLWKQFLGQDVDPACVPSTLGITSAATVIGGVVYVGGGDGNWYALDANTGNILWSINVGDITAGYYNWSSPLIVNGAAYIGIASNCDEPLVRGALLKVDLTSHAVVATHYFVPPGQVGGGVWTSPTYDAATNTVFVSTGTLDDPTQTQSQALVALDAGTLALESYWQLPASQAIGDADWGASPTLITDPAGDQLLAAANKNGILYVLDRNNLAAGPVWEQQIAIPGACPTCGDGSISSGVFANGVLYYAGGHSLVNGHGAGGSISAFDPATGNLLWKRQTDSSVVAAPAYVNGMIGLNEGATFEVLDASNGQLLYSYLLPAPAYAAVSVATGQFYVGALDGGLYAFGIGLSATTPPTDPNCPVNFMCRDIGQHTAGSESLNAGVLTVTAAGAPLGGKKSDQYRSIGQLVTGDSQSSVTLVQQSTGSGPPQAGLMVRQRYDGNSTDVGAPYFAVLAQPNDVVNGKTVSDVVVLYRGRFGVAPTRLALRSPANAPVSLMIQRTGNWFSAGVSSDGVHFTLIPGSSVRIDLPATTLQGLAVNSGATVATATAGFTNLVVGAPVTTTMTPVAPAHPCPTGWTCADIGNPSPPGDTTVSSGGALVLAGTGTGFDRGYLTTTSTDSFHYVYKSVTGAHTLTARVIASTTASTAQAGLMFRASAVPSAPVYAAYVTAGGSLTVEWRTFDGVLFRYPRTVAAATSPVYLKITRTTQASPPATIFNTLWSTDGTTWTGVPGAKVAINMGAGTYLAGLGASAAGPSVTTPATFGSVKLT